MLRESRTSIRDSGRERHHGHNTQCAFAAPSEADLPRLPEKRPPPCSVRSRVVELLDLEATVACGF